jgi:hypothetical protein
MSTKVHLSSEALNAAPWAAHLVSAFSNAPARHPEVHQRLGGADPALARSPEIPRA